MSGLAGKKALVLSALGADAEHGAATRAFLEASLVDRGCDVEIVDCLEVDVIPCTGCGSCGLKTPGTCAVQDDMQAIFRRIVASDVLVLATPVRFGSCCAELKKVVDRFQPLMVPIYVVRDGEMHFRGRYDLPALLGVGPVRAARGGEGVKTEADAFRFLIGRLAVNVDARWAAAAFTSADDRVLREELVAAVDAVAAVAP